MNPPPHAQLEELYIFDERALVASPLVSVMVLAYNHADYLESAIDGVLAQEVNFPIEILIGEDCSTDRTREIALRYQRLHPNLIKIITAEKNVGIQRNWQRLIAASRGEFLAHLDGDDYWLPGKLALQIEFLKAHPHCAAVYTGALTIDNSGATTGYFNNVGTAQFDLSAMLRRGNFLNTSSMIYRGNVRNVLLDIDELFIDYRAHLRLARHGLLAQLGDHLTAYRVNSIGSMTSTSSDLVRKLYWEAITDVPLNMVSANDMAMGLADFLRRVTSRAVREMRWDLMQTWAPKVFLASPYGMTRTTLLVISSAIRAVALSAYNLIARRPGTRALHRR